MLAPAVKKKQHIRVLSVTVLPHLPLLCQLSSASVHLLLPHLALLKSFLVSALVLSDLHDWRKQQWMIQHHAKPTPDKPSLAPVTMSLSASQSVLLVSCTPPPAATARNEPRQKPPCHQLHTCSSMSWRSFPWLCSETSSSNCSANLFTLANSDSRE